MKVRQPTERHGGTARTDEGIHVSELTSPCGDARDCPQCGARGILPLEQDRGEDAAPGTIENPVMICPVCLQEFRSTGRTWLGVWDIADMTDENRERMVDAVIERMEAVARKFGK